MVSDTSGSEAAFASVDLSECDEDDFGSIFSSSDDLSRVLCLCMKVAGEFGLLFVLRAGILSSEVREIFFAKFEDSLGARLREEVSDGPVSRRPLGFAVV
jgi:hypothetical protein